MHSVARQKWNSAQLCLWCFFRKRASDSFKILLFRAEKFVVTCQGPTDCTRETDVKTEWLLTYCSDVNLHFDSVWRVAGESLRLARDFGYLCETEFPAAQTAEHVTRQYAATRLPAELHHRRQMIFATKCVSSVLIVQCLKTRSLAAAESSMLRVIEYFSKSLKITESHWSWYLSKAWVRFSIRLPWLYLVSFPR